MSIESQETYNDLRREYYEKSNLLEILKKNKLGKLPDEALVYLFGKEQGIYLYKALETWEEEIHQ